MDHNDPSGAVLKAIMIQPYSNDYSTLKANGFVLTFPRAFGDSKAIHPKQGGKTYTQALKRALRWQKRLERLFNKRFPIVLNDTRYSWPQFNTCKNNRYQFVA